MPKILVNVSEVQKGVWVREAHGELVSLSEWVRRACDARAGLGAGGDREKAGRPSQGSVLATGDPSPPAPSPPGNDDAVTPVGRPGLVSSAGSFRPDPKVKK